MFMETFDLDKHLIKLHAKNFTFEEGFEKCLGINNASLRLMKLSIANDLDRNEKGIKWWNKDKLDKATNIILADYLFSLPLSIEENLLNAHLYKVEVELKTKKRNLLLKDSIELTVDGYNQSHPGTFEFYLNQSQLSRNATGFFIAVGSLLDCLAALIIGVCGLEKNLITASFPTLIRNSEQKTVKCLLENNKHFVQLNILLERKNLEWAQWIIDLRNMYIHRSKRLNYEMLHPKPLESLMLNKHGKPILNTTATRHLPKAPHLTEVEAMGIYKGKPIHLNEDQTVTIEGILQDVTIFTNEVCSLLIKIWKCRKGNPDLHYQPSAQWDEGKHIKERNKKGNWFDGYTPSERQEISSASVSPELHYRMEAAALSDSEDAIWKEFRKKHLDS